MPLGHPPALVSLAGVVEAPEQVGTTAVIVPASAKATRKSGMATGVALPLIVAVMVACGAPPEKGKVPAPGRLWIVTAWLRCAQPKLGVTVSVPSSLQLGCVRISGWLAMHPSEFRRVSSAVPGALTVKVFAGQLKIAVVPVVDESAVKIWPANSAVGSLSVRKPVPVMVMVCAWSAQRFAPPLEPDSETE